MKKNSIVILSVPFSGLRVKTTVIVIAHATTLYRKFFSMYSHENYEIYVSLFTFYS